MGTVCRVRSVRGILNTAIISVILIGGPLLRGPADGAESFVRGRVNADSTIDLSDPVTILTRLFIGGAPLACDKAADIDDNGVLEITDAIKLLSFLFLGGVQPPPPFPEAGSDPTPDSLPCGSGGPTSIDATPSPLALPGTAATAQLVVTGRGAGAPTDLTAGSKGTTYATADPKVALAYRDGKVEGVGPGSTTITVRNSGLEASVSVSVGTAGASPDYRILAVSDQGIRRIDREYSVFSLFPPHNAVNVQAVRLNAAGTPTPLDGTTIDVRYSPVPDALGSVNTRSAGKSGFWDHALALYGATLQPGQGLTGLFMPDDGPSPGPQPIPYNTTKKVFRADGIPVIDKDDAGATATYPLLRVSAFDKATGNFLSSIDIVTPVSSEMSCKNCHLTGQIAASLGGISWSSDPDQELQSKKNILLLHDHKNGTDHAAHTPVLCSSCHYSKELDLAGTGPKGDQLLHSAASKHMHDFHGTRLDGQGNPVFPPGGTIDATCYQCHPGAQTKYLRGNMAAAGILCRNCHGDMHAVGGTENLAPGGSIDGKNDNAPRRPWVDLPRCQSCHTGDANTHLSGAGLQMAADGIRLTQAYRDGDAAASPILATNKRFAENANTSYRNGKGHGGLLCQVCHGSTHAEWANPDPAANDNVAAMQIQGHTGRIVECKSCHPQDSLPLTIDGPHNMHFVDDPRWTNGGHKNFWQSSPNTCKACHGKDLLGTALSVTAVDRTLTVKTGVMQVAKGTKIACDLCHTMPQ